MRRIPETLDSRTSIDPRRDLPSFIARFLRIIGEKYAGETWTTGIPRRVASKVLLGVPWRFIPCRLCERHPFIEIGHLAMLCCCLDDVEVAATPGHVTSDQILLAWTAAGFENWLKRVTLRELRERADRAVLTQHADLFAAAIASAIEHLTISRDEEVRS